MRISILIYFCLISLICVDSLAQDITPEDQKFALIIGNSDYDQDGRFTKKENTPAGRMNDLPNACSDAKLISGKLEALGWKIRNIVTLCDASKSSISNAIDDLSRNILENKNPLGFFYYAGHGIQVGSDTYIFGTDTEVNIEVAVDIYERIQGANLFIRGGLRLRENLLANISNNPNGSIFLVLDACRENPIASVLRARQIKTISAPKKDAVRPVIGLKFLYSTANGELASDGVGAVSPFAEEFAASMKQNKTINSLVDEVTNKVYDRTKDTALPQVPDNNGSFRVPPERCLGTC